MRSPVSAIPANDGSALYLPSALFLFLLWFPGSCLPGYGAEPTPAPDMPRQFVHPGLLNLKAGLDFVKANDRLPGRALDFPVPCPEDFSLWQRGLVAQRRGGGQRERILPDYNNEAPARDPAVFTLIANLTMWNATGHMAERDHHNIHGVNLNPDNRKELLSVQVSKTEPGYLVFSGAPGVPARQAVPSRPFSLLPHEY